MYWVMCRKSWYTFKLKSQCHDIDVNRILCMSLRNCIFCIHLSVCADSDLEPGRGRRDLEAAWSSLRIHNWLTWFDPNCKLKIWNVHLWTILEHKYIQPVGCANLDFRYMLADHRLNFKFQSDGSQAGRIQTGRPGGEKGGRNGVCVWAEGSPFPFIFHFRSRLTSDEHRLLSPCFTWPFVKEHLLQTTVNKFELWAVRPLSAGRRAIQIQIVWI